MKNFSIMKRMWVLILTSIFLGLSTYATQIPIPSTPDSLEHFLENHPDMYANGDTILLVDPSYVVNGTADLYHGVTIMGDPALPTPPVVQFLDNGFRLKQDSTSVYIKGLYLNGFNDDESHRAKFILRMDNIPASDSIFYNMVIEDVEAVGFGGGIDLHQQKHAEYDSITVNNVIWHDFSGEYCIDPNINFPGILTVTNSTFYNITHGFVKNPDFASDKNNYTKIPKTYNIDHNTFYNVGGYNNALIQVNDPQDSTVTFTFTNNIVEKLYDPTNVRPFRINESAGTFDFNTNVIYDFMPTNPDKMQYSFDSTVANQTNVTEVNTITDDPKLLDVGDFRLPVGSPLLTADTEGGQIGDPRWATFEGVYIYEPEGTVYTNNPVQLEAAIELASGDTVLNWEVEINYGETRGAAEIVDSTGLLTPTVPGMVKVTATSEENGAFFDTLIVTIQDSIHVEDVTLIPDGPAEISEKEGDLDIVASLTPTNPTNPLVNFSLSDDFLADFYVRSDTTIELVARADGIVSVYAVTEDGGLMDTLDITITNQFPDGLIAHWKFDETSGTTAEDEILDSDGTLNNMGDALWVAGLDGNCLDFGSGVDTSYVQVDDNPLIDMDSTETFSISILISLSEFPTASGKNLFLKGNTGVNPDIGAEGKWYSMETKEGEMRFSVDDNVTKTQLGVNVSNILSVDNWAHVVGVRDRALDSMFLYLNGVKIGSALDLTDLDISTGLPLIIGNNHNKDNNFPGKIDDFKIYNRALTGEEIAAMTAEYGITPVKASFDVTNVVDGEIDDFEGSFSLSYDEDSVYLSITVVDDTIYLGDANAYVNDNIEVYFDMDNSKNPNWPRDAGTWPVVSYDDNDYQLRLVPEADFSVNNSLGGVSQTYNATADGYEFTLHILWDSLMVGFDPADGTIIGFDLLISDNDGPYRNQITWMAPTALVWTDASLIGTIKLTGGMIEPMPDTEAPSTPANVAEADLVVTWDASTDNTAIYEYVIYNGDDELATQIALESGNSYTLDLAEGTYTIGVVAVDNYGNTSDKATVDVTVGPEGTDNVTLNEIRVYPNPANDFITINIEQQSHIKILNLTGEVVIDKIIEVGGSIDIQELANGVYIINVYGGDQISTLRFVKE